MSKFDKEMTDKDVSQILSAIYRELDFPKPLEEAFKLKEYDRSTRQVFLYVTKGFTEEQEEYVQDKARQYIHKRTRVSVVRKQSKFKNLTTDKPKEEEPQKSKYFSFSE